LEIGKPAAGVLDNGKHRPGGTENDSDGHLQAGIRAGKKRREIIMDARGIAHYKQLLEDRLAELNGRLHQIESDLDAPAPQDDEERATEREGDEVLEDLGNIGLAEIKMIEAALDRIEAGTYGVCVECGEDISTERLDVLPHTPRCRDCA